MLCLIAFRHFMPIPMRSATRQIRRAIRHRIQPLERHFPGTPARFTPDSAKLIRHIHVSGNQSKETAQPTTVSSYSHLDNDRVFVVFTRYRYIRYR